MKAATKTVLASAVVIALCLCAVGGVTYSWFSDSEQTEIDITTGNIQLDITVGDVTVQSYGGDPINVGTSGVTTDLGGTVSYNTSSTDTTTALTIEFQNAAPGDILTFEIGGSIQNSIDVMYYESYSITGPSLDSPFIITNLTTGGTSYAANDDPTIAEKNITITMDTAAGNEYMGVAYTITILFEAIQENAPQTPSTTTDIDQGSNSITVNNASGESAAIEFDNSSSEAGSLTVSMVDTTDSDYSVTGETVLAGISVTPSESGSNLAGIDTTVTFQIDGDLTNVDLTIYHNGSVFIPTKGITKNYDSDTHKTTVSFITSSGFSTYIISTDAEAVVNGTYYNTLESAISAATDNQTVSVLNDVVVENTIIIDGKELTLDLGNNSITNTTIEQNGKLMVVRNGAVVTINGGTIVSSGIPLHVFFGGNVTVNDTHFDTDNTIMVSVTSITYSDGTTATATADVYTWTDTLTLNDVIVDSNYGCVTGFTNAHITINGGEFNDAVGGGLLTNGAQGLGGQVWNVSNATFNIYIDVENDPTAEDYIGVGIQCHNAGTWNITGCTFNMDHGVALSVRGGNVTVTDCTYNYTNSEGYDGQGNLQFTDVAVDLTVPYAIAAIYFSNGAYGWTESSSLTIDGELKTIQTSTNEDRNVQYFDF